MPSHPLDDQTAVLREAHLKAALLASIVDFSDDAIFTMGLDGTILSWNPGAEQIFGYNAEEVVGRKLLLSEEERKEDESILAQVAGGEPVEHLETARQRKNGSRIDVSLTACPVPDATGSIAAVCIMMRDITSRKLFEENGALLLASIVASSQDGIISKSLGGIINSWNTGAERMFGFHARQAIGRHISIIVPPEKLEEEAIILDRLNHGEEIQHLETVRMRVNGQRIPVEITVSALRNGEGRLIGASKFIRDISQRTEAETERRHAEARLRAVLDHAGDGIITINARGNVESFNPACTRIFGYATEEVIGKNVRMLMPEPYRGSHDGYLTRYAAGGEPRVVGKPGREVVGKRKDGSIFPMDLSVCVFELEDGKHYSGILRDITARKAAEAQHEEFAMELTRYAMALKRSNQELDAFAYAASHDLKAPLRVIQNASTWIEEDLAGNMTGEIREHMTLLRSRVRRMDRLLDDLLEYSRIGREADKGPAEAISGTALLETIEELLPPHESFTIVATASFRGIQVFRMPLQQILTNLVSNAIKHHDKKLGHIELSVEDLGSMYHFLVKDDGPGIPPQYHEQVFRMFQTLKPRDQVEGSGMGLAMVRKHIDCAGGEVSLESAVGHGSTFGFTWPKQDIKRQAPNFSFARVEET